MPQEFPKLLVATEFPPNIPGGGGAIVRQMLKDWPTEKLFWWSCQPDLHKQYSQNVASHAVANFPPRLYPKRRWRAPKSWFLEKFWVPWATRHFLKTLDAIQPHVIWAIPHGWSIPPLVNVLRHANTPYHLTIYDYADGGHFIESFGLERCRARAQQVEQLYAGAATRDCVSREMINDMEARTGAGGGINRTGLEQEDFDFLAQEPQPQAGPIRIGYAGTIIAADECALIVRALAQIRNQLPRPMTLEFFGDHSYRSRDWFDTAWMNEHGNLNKPALSKALRECDWGLAPMRLTNDDPRYNNFSLPTKPVSYLAAGLPVIAMGHPDSTLIKMASKYAIGLCLTDGNIEKLKAQLLAGLSEPNPRMKYRAEILRCALAEFDAGRMRAALYENFRRGAAA